VIAKVWLGVLLADNAEAANLWRTSVKDKNRQDAKVAKNFSLFSL